MPVPVNDVAEVAKLLVPSGVVIGAVKYIMNGWRSSLQRIESKQDHHGDVLGDLSERTVRIETKLEQCPSICPPVKASRRKGKAA
jgi:hypothetical protein